MKPLGGKAYGHIGHLGQSRMGPGDHKVVDGQSAICTVKTRDKHDTVVVTEKLDGSCTAVANVDGKILALGRAGYLAQTAPYEQHQLFADWVRKQEDRFLSVLKPGQRLCGEWLAQAHGTRYDLKHEPWVVFDLMEGKERALFDDFRKVADAAKLARPYLISYGPPISVEWALQDLGEFGRHGALDPIEGAVWRVERQGKVDFLAKYVRPDKADGILLPEISGQPAVWNWRP